MAIFDNISYGVSPQFSTSPDVVKMDFFSDISSLGGLISAKSSAGASGGSGKDDKYDPMLYNQQVQTGQQRALLDMRKQSFVDNYMAKARELVKKTPGLTMPKATTMLGEDIQAEALQLRMQENDFQANSELHKRNVKFAEADYKNEKKKGQLTLLQLGPNGETFVGYDKDGKITYDKSKITTTMTNAQYYEEQNKLNYGEVYHSPIEIDEKQGDEFIRKAMTNAGGNFHEGGGSREGMPNAKEMIAFKQYYDASAMKTVNTIDKDNIMQLKNEANILLKFLPLDSRRAIEQEYLIARTKPIAQYKTVVDGKVTYKYLKDMSYEEGMQSYMLDKVWSLVDSEHDTIKKTDISYTLDKNSNSNSDGTGNNENTNWWYNVARNKKIGAKSALFNNPNAEKNIYISDYGNKLEAFKERRRNAIKKQTKDWTEAQVDDYVNGEKAMQDFETEYKTTGVTFNAISKSGLLAKEIEKDGLGGLFTVGENVNSTEYKGTPGYGGSVFGSTTTVNKNPYKRTSFPVSEEQLNRNYGENIIKYDVEGINQFSHAGVGASAGGDVYGEGMVKFPETVKNDLITVSTNAVYQGVQRPGGKSSNALAQKRGIIHKDRLAQMKGKLWSNGKSQEYSYDANDYVQATLGVEELTKAEMQDYLDIAKNEKNMNGLSKLNKIKGKESNYVVVTFYEDFQESAENLSMLQANRKDLYPPIQGATSGTEFIKPY